MRSAAIGRNCLCRGSVHQQGFRRIAYAGPLVLPCHPATFTAISKSAAASTYTWQRRPDASARNPGVLRHGVISPFFLGIITFRKESSPHNCRTHHGCRNPEGTSSAETATLQRGAQNLRQRPVGPQRLASAAQNNGIPGTSGEHGRRIAGDGAAARNKTDDLAERALADITRWGASIPGCIRPRDQGSRHLFHAAGPCAPHAHVRSSLSRNAALAAFRGPLHIKAVLPTNLFRSARTPAAIRRRPEPLRLQASNSREASRAVRPAGSRGDSSFS